LWAISIHQHRWEFRVLVYDAQSRILTIELRGITSRILISILIVALISPAIFSAYGICMAEYLAHWEGDLPSYAQAIRYDPANGEYWWMHGRFLQYDLESPDLPGAIASYEQALALNPRLGKAWLDLAEAYERTGNAGRAEKSLTYALKVRAFSPSAHWQAGNFYLFRGDLPKMYACFKVAGEHDPEKLRAALQLAWKVDADHSGIQEKMIPDTLPAQLSYLDFLVAQDELTLAKSAWDKSLRLPIPNQFQFRVALAFSYIDHLILSNRAKDAFRVWQQALDKAGSKPDDERAISGVQAPGSDVNLVWNGSFEDEILNGGWDWRYINLPNVDVLSDRYERFEGLRSLNLGFGGINIAYQHLRQIVPVFYAGKYRLVYFVKTNNLTSDQRPYFAVRAFPANEKTYLRTEMVPVDSEWREYSLEFEIERGINAIELILMRDFSQKLGNQIQGSVWLDQISIRRIGNSEASVAAVGERP
jgi:tetratricopeptide (TPR) repeat protein